MTRCFLTAFVTDYILSLSDETISLFAKRRIRYDSNVDKETAFADKKDALRSLYHEVGGDVQSGDAAY